VIERARIRRRKRLGSFLESGLTKEGNTVQIDPGMNLERMKE